MDNAEPIRDELGPLEKTITVACSVEQAFETFTTGMDRWWPKHRFSVSQERTAAAGIEPRVGGEVYEVRDDGERFAWGTVLAWEPPNRFVMTWHPGRSPDTAQQVEIRFVPDGTGTRVELEHRDWDVLGDDAAKSRANYASGWDAVLGQHFAPACAGSGEASR